MIPFLKMHGIGNDFAIFDGRKTTLPALDWKKIADRNRGIGCDQVVVLEPSAAADIFMRLYNADGSQAESCGNASRCVAWLIADETSQKETSIETRAGIAKALIRSDGTVTVDMGMAHLGWRDIPLAQEMDTLHLPIALGALKDPVAVSMGNPHMVFFVPDAALVPLHTLGPELERHALYPNRANVGVAQIEAQDKIILRVWERGAGPTLACGTGACAALVAASLRGLTGRKANVTLPGGNLHIEWREADGHVLMTGPVALSFKGTLEEKDFLLT